jgi:hypothetical protein
MSKKKKDPLLEALAEGRSYEWTVPDGGNLASMRKAIKHGQTLTLSPIQDPAEILVGDKVLVRWHGGDIFHLVGDIQGDQYLIVNSMGGVNGWVIASEILGRVTKVVEPEPRPGVLEMLGLLEVSFQRLIESEQPSAEAVGRLLSIVDDLRWYASRLGESSLDEMPRSNKWSFIQNLWHLAKAARGGQAPVPDRLAYFTDLGKQCVGKAAEIIELFETDPKEAG